MSWPHRNRDTYNTIRGGGDGDGRSSCKNFVMPLSIFDNVDVSYHWSQNNSTSELIPEHMVSLPHHGLGVSSIMSH